MLLLLFIFGLLLLIAGAELLVRGASKLAIGFGISPLVVGLTFVAFGTSAPELAVSIKGALSGQADLVMGNVVGSNIFNVLVILGIAALILPLAVQRRIVRVEIPIMISFSLLAYGFGLNGTVSRIEGFILLMGLFCFTTFLYIESRRSQLVDSVESKVEAEMGAKNSTGSIGRNIFLIVVGLGLLVQGADWFVNSAVGIARHFKVSELIIGLTIVAAGTSMPELMTSIVASLRGERDIAVGNVIGSNIFNVVGVLGAGALLGGNGVRVSAEMISVDIPFMLFVAVICLPIFFTGWTISRKEGAGMLLLFVGYTTYLILR